MGRYWRVILLLLALWCSGAVWAGNSAPGKVAAQASTVDAITEQKRLKFLIRPLVGPNPATVESLDSYLREAFWRVNPLGIEGSNANALIPKFDEPDVGFYKRSKEWLSTVLLKDSGGERNISIAAMPSDNPFYVLREMMRSQKRGRLNCLTIYFMATDAQWPDVEEIFAGSGAKLVQLNPEKAIPQRPERLAFARRLLAAQHRAQ